MTNLFLASSPVELVSACIVRRFLGEQPAVLLFNLGLNREIKLVKQMVEELSEFWDRIIFIEPGEVPGLSSVSTSSIHRLWYALRTSRNHAVALRRKLTMCLGEHQVNAKGEGVSVYFNHLHPHVFYVFGWLPRARRGYYPHGLDQPRRRQIQQYAFQFATRGVRTILRTWSNQRVFRRSFYFIRAWLWLAQSINIPFPFDGVDRAMVFSGAEPEVPHERIPEKFLKSVLAEISEHRSEVGSLSEFFAGLQLDRVCLVLLPELDSSFDNANYLSALEALVASVLDLEPITTFVFKPHPRSSYEGFQVALKCLRGEISDRTILGWPKQSITVQTELVVAAFRVRCVASIGSCALPPWAAFGVPHYVSREAARRFDAGWPNEKRAGRNFVAFTEQIIELEDEKLVHVIE